jgi:hypothetical protein
MFPAVDAGVPHVMTHLMPHRGLFVLSLVLARAHGPILHPRLALIRTGDGLLTGALVLAGRHLVRALRLILAAVHLRIHLGRLRAGALLALGLRQDRHREGHSAD